MFRSKRRGGDISSPMSFVRLAFSPASLQGGFGEDRDLCHASSIHAPANRVVSEQGGYQADICVFSLKPTCLPEFPSVVEEAMAWPQNELCWGSLET